MLTPSRSSSLLAALLCAMLAASTFVASPALARLPPVGGSQVVDGRVGELTGTASVTVKKFAKLKDRNASLRVKLLAQHFEALDPLQNGYAGLYTEAKGKLTLELDAYARTTLRDALADWLIRAYEQAHGATIDVSVQLHDVSILMKLKNGKAQLKMRADFTASSSALGGSAPGKYQAKLKGFYDETKVAPASGELRVELAGAGSGSVEGIGIACVPDCIEHFAGAPLIELRPQPSGASVFESWSGCDWVSGEVCFIRMFRDAVVTATFVAQPPSDVWLEVRKEGTGGGSIEGLGIQCGSDCSEGYAPGTPLVLEARPAQGSVFKGWDGCQVTRGTQCFLAPQADRVVTATFNRLIILGKVPGDGSAPGPALGVGHVRVAATPGGVGVAGAR